MLKGDVFSNQLYNVHMFALFQDLFLNQKSGIADGYKNNMNITASGTNITINSGACIIRGRQVEEDSSTTLSTASITNKNCALVIEIDLSKTNTDSSLLQASYKILQSSSGTPALTQQDIINNYSSGVYQYLLATFQTNASGTISNLVKTDTRLSIESVYNSFEEQMTQELADLQTAINNVTTDTVIGRLEDVEEIASNTQYKHYNYPTGTRTISLDNTDSGYAFIEMIYGKGGTRKSTGRIPLLADTSQTVLLDQAQIIGSTFQIYSAICTIGILQLGTRQISINGNEGYANYNMSTNTWGSRTSETDMKIYDIYLYKSNEVE